MHELGKRGVLFIIGVLFNRVGRLATTAGGVYILMLESSPPVAYCVGFLGVLSVFLFLLVNWLHGFFDTPAREEDIRGASRSRARADYLRAFIM